MSCDFFNNEYYAMINAEEKLAHFMKEHEHEYSEKEKDMIYKGLEQLKIAKIYLRCIDRYLSQDDNGETFLIRIENELKNIKM